MQVILPDHKTLISYDNYAIWGHMTRVHINLALDRIQPIAPPILKSTVPLKGPHMFHFRMFPIFAIIALLGLTNSLAVAAPPTHQNWWEYMDRYMGEFQMQSPEYREPILSFQANWSEPRKVMHFSSKSIGNAPMQNMIGFTSWNERTNRLEWQEVVLSEEHGRFAATGFCVNATKDTMTWVVTVFNVDGFVRQYTMVDTHSDKGLERSVQLLRGEELDTTISRWIKMK